MNSMGEEIDFATVYYKARVIFCYLCKMVFFVELLSVLGELCSSIDCFHAVEIWPSADVWEIASTP